MRDCLRWSWWVMVVAFGIGGGAVLLAQGRDDQIDARALVALTAELRQLRIAVEELARSQTQAQALGALVTVQDSRVRLVAGRLDAARRERDDAVEQGKALGSELRTLSTERGQATDVPRRDRLDEAIQQLTLEQSAVFEREQESRRREADLARQLLVEESRWTEVIHRLEHLGR